MTETKTMTGLFGWQNIYYPKLFNPSNYNGVSGTEYIDHNKAKRHIKHARKIQKWKGRMTKHRMNLIIDELAAAQRATMPKYRWINGMRMNLHEMLA